MAQQTFVRQIKRKTEEGFELGWVAPEEEEDYLGIASTALNYVILKWVDITVHGINPIKLEY